MLTTRMRPKISVKPLATTKYSAAAVRPLSSVIRKFFGSLTAEPKVAPLAMKSTQMTGRAIAAAIRTLVSWSRSGRFAATSFMAERQRNRTHARFARVYGNRFPWDCAPSNDPYRRVRWAASSGDLGALLRTAGQHRPRADAGGFGGKRRGQQRAGVPRGELEAADRDRGPA